MRMGLPGYWEAARHWMDIAVSCATDCELARSSSRAPLFPRDPGDPHSPAQLPWPWYRAPLTPTGYRGALPIALAEEAQVTPQNPADTASSWRTMEATTANRSAALQSSREALAEPRGLALIWPETYETINLKKYFFGHEVVFWAMTKKIPKKFFRCFWVPHAEKHPKTQ